MTDWEKMSFAGRKQNGKGHLFRVGCGFQFEAPYRFNLALPPAGKLKLNDVVLVLENPSMYVCGGYFWKVLSKVGVVWTETKFFSSEF
jgi:hypothetical protein